MKLEYQDDYAQDYIRWFNKNQPSDIIYFQQEIIKKQDEAFAYFYAIEYKHKSHLMQQVILKQKSAKYAFYFALNIPNADLKALQNIVVSSKKIKYILKFACQIAQNDLNLFQIILKCKKPRYLFELARKINDSQRLLQLQEAVIESGNLIYIRLFAEHIPNADVEKLEQLILDSGNVKEIKKFARHIKNSKMKQFLILL